MSAASQAHKFMVWRAYHQIKAEIGRAPTLQEIADEVGLSRTSVQYWMRRLKTCEPTWRGRYSELRNERMAETATRVPDLITMFGAT